MNNTNIAEYVYRIIREGSFEETITANYGQKIVFIKHRYGSYFYYKGKLDGIKKIGLIKTNTLYNVNLRSINISLENPNWIKTLIELTNFDWFDMHVIADEENGKSYLDFKYIILKSKIYTILKSKEEEAV